jgi:hypothetical protein
MGQKTEKIKSQRESQVFRPSVYMTEITINVAGYC